MEGKNAKKTERRKRMLRALLLAKSLKEKRSQLEALKAAAEELSKREAELANDIEAAETDEEKEAVTEAIEAYETEKAENEEKTRELESEVAELEEQLKETESAPAATAGEGETRTKAKGENKMPAITKRYKFFKGMDEQTRSAIFEREEVKSYLSHIRETIATRAVTGANLLIPEVFLGLLKENVLEYSKLVKYTRLVPVSGDGRQVVQGTAPEGIWTECCAILNELSLTFNDAEVNCYKVGGFIKMCNAVLEDADIDLAETLLEAIAEAIGMALDKAILYGRNSSTTQKMPMGIVTRLAQTSQPSDYPTTARPWVDLHSTNIISIAASVTGAELFKALVLASANMKSKYSRGSKVWVMNDSTYTKLVANAVTVDSNGRIVAGVNGGMPVIGGVIEVLDFIPDDVIIGGYFDLYLLAERAGAKFASSEHAFFIQDATVFKGTARYDGLPVIAEGFVAIGINGVTPSAAMTFAPDNANTVQNVLIDRSVASVAVNATLQLKATTVPVQGNITWASSDATKATVDATGKVTGVAEGSAVITATSGDAVASCEVTVVAGA